MRRGKYNNRFCKSGGITFDSKIERDYYHHLLWRQKVGEISSLEVHKKFPLNVNGITIGNYEADFTFNELEYRNSVFTNSPCLMLHQKIHDVKGCITDLFRWKSKHFTIQYGLPITIVTKKKGRWIIK